MMDTYPENDYRTYLEHSSSHKYVSRKRGKGGKWIYTYTVNTYHDKPDGYIAPSGKKVYYDDIKDAKPDGYIAPSGKKVYYDDIKDAKPDGYIDSNGKKVYRKDKKKSKKKTKKKTKLQKILSAIFK